MRIGIDIRLWNQTGVGRYIRNLVIELLKIDHKNKYVLFARTKDINDIKLTNPNWKIVKTDINWHSIAEQVKFPKVLEKENLDLMHFPYFSVPVFYQKPFVVTIHDLIINHYPTGKASTLFPIFYYLKLIFYKFIIYKASKNARKIIVPSMATKDEVIDHFKISENKIAVTKEAANLIANNNQVFSNKYTKYFLYVGNAYPHKNLENLINAFNNFSKNKDIKLILVGKKDYFYKRLQEQTKSQNIVFFGQATDQQLQGLYKNALCLVMPSFMEGFGLPVLEAMANKCPVICSNIPSLKEIAKESALYFNPKETLEMQKAMAVVFEGKYSKEMVESAYQLAGQYSFEKMARETLKIYESSISLR